MLHLLLINELHFLSCRSVFLDMPRKAECRPPGVGEGEPRRRVGGVENINLDNRKQKR